MVPFPATDAGINPSQGQRQRHERNSQRSRPHNSLTAAPPYPPPLLLLCQRLQRLSSTSSTPTRQGESCAASTCKMLQNLKCIIFLAHPQSSLPSPPLLWLPLLHPHAVQSSAHNQLQHLRLKAAACAHLILILRSFLSHAAF